MEVAARPYRKSVNPCACVFDPTKMAASLSAYWVKFFKSAGFPLDVATKHAVVFSNNRIKPDMLPDLDKPSLKDMGITLMGDMIAILRYAKKVVEETTCERFLVDTEDDKPSGTKSASAPRPVAKKVAPKVPATKTVVAKPKIVQETVLRPAKPPTSAVSKTVAAAAAAVKKKIAPSTRVVSQVVKEKAQIPVKRKIPPVQEVSDSSESDEEWNGNTQKRLKKLPPVEEEKVGYTVIMPKGRTIRSQEMLKKITEQKRTVFDRLGDSSVTSTTNLAETSPTFNITGLGSDVLKRNSSVFNRLGDKDAKKPVERPFTGILKNGNASKLETTASASPPGILKNRPSSIGSTTISLKPTRVTSKSTGTMHADHEKSQKAASSSVRQLVRTTKKIRLVDGAQNNMKIVRKVAGPSTKLGHVLESKYDNNYFERVQVVKKNASERVGSVPAKARLGLAGSAAMKQVTFDRLTTVAHIKKPGVFSRLGI